MVCYGMMLQMSEENQKPQKDSRQSGGNDPQNWRGLILLVLLFALIGGAFLFGKTGSLSQSDNISNAKFIELLKAGQVVSTPEKPLEFISEGGLPTQTISGTYRKK